MRLIDADALKAMAYKGGAFDYQLVVDWSDIEAAPTIDAVPVAMVRGNWGAERHGRTHAEAADARKSINFQLARTAAQRSKTENKWAELRLRHLS